MRCSPGSIGCGTPTMTARIGRPSTVDVEVLRVLGAPHLDGQAPDARLDATDLFLGRLLGVVKLRRGVRRELLPDDAL
jgi:hypothetical protein